MIKKTVLAQILLSWMLIGSLLSAQKVTQIKFEGLSHLSPTSAKEIAGIHVGEEINAGKINTSIKKFFAQGYFKDVWVDQQGGILIYHFKEKMAIANVDIKGYGSGDDGMKLLEGIGLKKGDLYDERRVKKAKRTLIAKLESQGYYDTVVDVSTTPIGESSIAIAFDVNKGEKIIIEEQNFVGAEELVQSDLELELANKEKDFLGWMPWRNNGEATVDQLEYDAYRVKDVYMRHGYLDAYVSKPLMRVDFGSYKAKVDYQVIEGVQYRVGTIGISQDVKGLDTEDLKDELILKEGKIFNIKRMRKDISILEEEVGNLGYAFVKVSPQMHKDPEKKIINLNYVVQPGEVVTINDVIISGNDTTKDRVIRRYIYLAPGDTFSARDLKDSKNALGRTGFFEKVDVESQRISADKINLLVKVKETSTGTISAGGGYGSWEGLMFNASISDRNFFGSGINTTIGFEVSKRSTNYTLSFVNPKVWDSMYSLGVSLYKKEYEYIDYTQDQLGGSVNIGREFYRYFHASVGLGYVDNQSTMNDTNSTLFDNYYFNLYNDQYKKTSLFASISFDNTDDFYVPREGMIAALNFEYGQLDGDDYNATQYPSGFADIFKTSAKVGFFYGLEDWIDYDLILRLKGRMTTILSDDDAYLPIAEKLFLGGIGSVRGYNPYSLSPLDPTTYTRTGGKHRASASVEASIPLSEAAKMRLAFFYDYGMIGEDSFNEITRSSTGVVVEWQSGFGPINLVFSYPIDEEVDDRTQAFEFSMGTKF
ncbi:outer membrane protein assembly factor BamA [Sulfurovum sp. XTW-4]|uniref:Outer membrane protein assembly factor BamA n=1 Tax=Sulfurovum xiamenensis TaxID=3019066 RepID=A0ABT7QPJ2_9BACT|nr:outer membrane protein assembly factor BamA [Sulfurovum xiamenensis]MDM5262988.1 outer membrane protein assembly factor BamA [Sulfurovum xiamenensis]